MSRRTRSYSLDNDTRTIRVGGTPVIDLSTSATNTVKTVGGAASQAVQVAATGDDDNIDLVLSPKGSGTIDFNGQFKFPTADGSANQVLSTDGSGQLSFSTISTNSVSQGNSSIAVADTGTGTVTIAVDGATIATFSSSSALNLSNITNAITLPTGTTGQRPAGVAGMLRYNTSTDKIEGYTTAGGWAELGASESEAEVADSGGGVIGIGLNTKNIDTFLTTAYDSAWYYAVTRDEVNGQNATQRISLVHNDTDAFVGVSHISATDPDNDYLALDADIDSGTVRLRGTGSTATNSISYYRVPLGDNTTNLESGNIKNFILNDTTTTTANVNSYVDTGDSTSISTTQKTIDSWAKTAYNSAIYFTINRDETNDEIQMAKYNVTHNGTATFMNKTHVVNSDDNNDYISVSTTMESNTVKLQATGVSETNSLSYYRIGLGATTVLAASDAVKTFYNSDVDDSQEILDTFSAASGRGAKYLITGKNTDTNATVVTEVLLTHDGSDAYVTAYGATSSTGATDEIFDFDADITSGNVRLLVTAVSANWAVIGHRVLLGDSESTTYDGSTADSHRTLDTVTVSSAATQIDTFNTSDHTGAFYVVTGYNATEGSASTQEVMVIAHDGNVYVSNGPLVSSKSTSQLSFTATISDGVVSLKASSSSGDSTTVSAWRIHIQRDAGGLPVIDSWNASSNRAAKYYFSVNDTETNKLTNTEALVVHNGTTSFINQYGTINTSDSSIITLATDLESNTVKVRANAGSARVTGYRILLQDDQTASSTSDSSILAEASVSQPNTRTNVNTYTDYGASTQITQSGKIVDDYLLSSYDSVWYLGTYKNETDSDIQSSKISLVHNGSAVYSTTSTVNASDLSGAYGTVTSTVADSKVKLNIVGGTDLNSYSYYRIGLGSSTALATSGAITTFANNDVDSAAEQIDTWAFASYRGAKYYISAKNSDTGEVTSTEALLTHNGSTAFISQFNSVNTSSGYPITLTADINGSNVRLLAAATSSNWSIVGLRILLSDSETNSNDGSTSTQGYTLNTVSNVSSSATEIDSFSSSTTNQAWYVAVANSPTEGTSSISEVSVLTDGTNAYVMDGPYVSSKDTAQLSFSASVISGTVSVKASSTSGDSTNVSLYKIQMYRPNAGAATASTVDTFETDAVTGAFYVFCGYSADEGTASVQEVMVVTGGDSPYGSDAFLVQGPAISSGNSDMLTFDASLSGTTVSVTAESSTGANAIVSGYRVNLLRGDGGEVAANVTVASDETISGQKNFAQEVGLQVIASAPSTVTNLAHIYAKDVNVSPGVDRAEVFVQDELGNETKISPHNAEGEWEYFSRNRITGKTVRINMEEMIRDIEQLTGKTYIKDQ